VTLEVLHTALEQEKFDGVEMPHPIYICLEQKDAETCHRSSMFQKLKPCRVSHTNVSLSVFQTGGSSVVTRCRMVFEKKPVQRHANTE